MQEADAATNSIALDRGIIRGRGALEIAAQRGSQTSLGLAGAPGTLNLSTAELALLQDDFASLTFRTDGAVTSNAATFTAPVKLIGTSVDLKGTVSAGANPVYLDAGTGTITLRPGVNFAVKASNVIGDASKVFVFASTLDLDGFNETVGGVQLFGGTITAAPGGTLTSATTFDLQEGIVHASLAGTNPAVGVIKVGDRTLSLSAPSTYAGGTMIRAGAIEFSHPQALGTGTVTLGDADTGFDSAALLATAVMNDGSLGQFNNDIVVANFGTGKSIIGTAKFNATGGASIGLHDLSTTFGGQLTLNKSTTLQAGNSDRTAFAGVIAGPVGTLSVEGGARVVLHGANSFSGPTGASVNIAGAGTTLQIEGDGSALASARNVDVASGATFALAANAPNPVVIRSLSGAGKVLSALAGVPQELLISDLLGGGGNFGGVIADGASQVSLSKFAGTQTLSGINTYTGPTLVKEGKLVLANATTNNNLALSSGITVNAPATLDVTGLDKGAVHDTLVLTNGQSLHGDGTVTGNVALSAGSTFAATAGGPAAGTLNVKGTVSLGDATLSLTGTPASAPHQEIVLIQNEGADAVAGTFHGLAEGAIVTLGGVKFNLSYHGGDGNDVTLEEGRSIYVAAAGITTAGAYGLPVVQVYNSVSGAKLFSITAYETKMREGIRVAVADMNGDGYDDIITTTATGTGRLRVFDGLTGQRFTSGPFAGELAVFDGKTDKGAFVAASDLTGDGRADLLIGSALGGGKVRVFDGATGTALTFATGSTFFQPFGKTFKGGIRVAAGDVNDNGVRDLVIGMNYYGATVQVYEGASLFATAGAAPAPVPAPLFSFNFGAKTYRGGVTIATGDFDGDGRADLLVGSNGGPTYVQAYSGLLKDTAGLPKTIGTPIYPFDKSPLKHLYALGVRVAAMDVNGDGIADIITASAGAAKSVVNVYSGVDHSLLRTFSAFPTQPYSALFVAASA